jgi:dGTPase
MVKHSHDFGPGERPELDAYLPGLRPLLEAQLIDLADEIAYNAADLDDAFSAGMFTAAEVAERVPQYGAILEAVETRFPGASAREQFHEALRQLIDALVSGLVEGTVANATRAAVADAEAVRHVPGRVAAFTEETADSSRALKQFLFAGVYAAPELAEDRRRSVSMIAELFGYFVEDPRRLPDPYARLAETDPPHRVVCDYIAGMTDAFCRRTYEQAFGPA